MSEITTQEFPEAIEYGGRIWRRVEGVEKIEYCCGAVLHISRYEGGSSHGRWWWGADLRAWPGADFILQVLDLNVSGIKDSMDEAMDRCLMADVLFVEDIKRLSVALAIDDFQYVAGFRDGQAALVEKVRGVLG